MPASIDDSEDIAAPEVVVNRTITLFCPASGIPIPELSWFRDTIPIVENSSDTILLDRNWRLRISPANVEHAGRYSCRAKNVAGHAEKFFDLSVIG